MHLDTLNFTEPIVFALFRSSLALCHIAVGSNQPNERDSSVYTVSNRFCTFQHANWTSLPPFDREFNWHAGNHLRRPNPRCYVSILVESASNRSGGGGQDDAGAEDDILG